MMNPEMMKMAQEQMSKMTPEQMQKMQEMARGMDPEVMRQAQANMANMDPSMIKAAMDSGNMERQMEAMDKMTPEQMEAQARAAASFRGGAPAPAPGPSTDPAVAKAVALKGEGNGLLKNKDFEGAAKAYSDAVAALDDATDAAGKQPVWTACQLNLAHAYLQQENFARAVAVCDRVIDSSSSMANPENRKKAHYRRGKGRKGLGGAMLPGAAEDLRKARKLAGAKEKGAIEELLKEVTAELKPEGEEEAGAGAAGDGGSDPRIEEIDESDEDDFVSGSEAGAVDPATATKAPRMPAPADMSSMADQMANMDPEVMKKQMEMMENMDDAQLEQMAEMNAKMRPGMPKISVAQMRQQVQMMKGMDPKTMKSMADMAKKMGGSGGPGQKMPSAAEAAEMMKDMDPQQMKAM